MIKYEERSVSCENQADRSSGSGVVFLAERSPAEKVSSCLSYTILSVLYLEIFVACYYYKQLQR